MNKYSCHVIQKVVEFCQQCEQMDPILEEILPIIHELTLNPNGNYVIQSILKNGPKQAKNIVYDKILAELLELSTHKYASNVVETCYKNVSAHQRKVLFEEFLRERK